MKILQVSHGFPPKENAGVELYTYYLSEALIQLHHPVSVFCRGDDPDKEEFTTYAEEFDGLKVIRIVNRLSRTGGVRSIYDNPFLDAPFVEILDGEKPDLIHFQHLYGLSGALVRLAKKRGLSIVLTLHDYFLICHRIQRLKRDETVCPGPLFGLECVSCLETPPPRDLRTKLFLKLKNNLPFSFVKWTKRFFIPPRFLDQEGYETFHRYRYMYEIFKACDLILTPSLFVRNFFIRYYPSMTAKIQALPLGIPPFKKPLSHKETDAKVRFCYFGTLFSHKGLHVLMDAFKSLPKGKAVLTLFGSVENWNRAYCDSITRLASGMEAHFRGPYRREDLPELLRDQDVAVFPAIWPETFSIVIREANLLGLPVIASRIGAIPEAIEEGINGFLVKPGDREDLRKTMLRFIDGPGLIQTMASRMKRPKTMEEHALEMVRIYNRLVEGER